MSKYGRRIFLYVHSFVTRVGKGRAGSGYEKGRVGAGAGTRRARTWVIWCVLGLTFDGFLFSFSFFLLGLYIIRIC